MEYSHGRMGISMKESGICHSKMEKDRIISIMEIHIEENT
jgi:hypothetical protein